MRIERIVLEAVAPAPAKASRVSLADAGARPTRPLGSLIVRVETDRKIIGETTLKDLALGQSAARSLLESDLPLLLIGEDPRRTDALFRKVESAFGALGFAGAASRAYSAIDLCLWDIKAKAAHQSLGDLLGGARGESPFFVTDTGGPTRPADDVVRLARPWIKKGAKGVLVEVGSGDVQADADRVRAVSDELGDDAWVGVNAMGRYDLGTAMALSHFFDDIGVGWFEEPIPISDVSGYARLAAHMETTLAAGSLCQSLSELVGVAQAGSVRVLRPDLHRLGGLTPILRLAAAAEAVHASIVPVGPAWISEACVRGLSACPQFERDSAT
jgi:L-alanine-DL-glutamate epimerase-like enolase superfamily enzyme